MKQKREELRIFPMSNSKMDVLDESEKGITYSRRPESIEDREIRLIEEEERMYDQGVMSASGY